MKIKSFCFRADSMLPSFADDKFDSGPHRFQFGNNVEVGLLSRQKREALNGAGSLDPVVARQEVGGVTHHQDALVFHPANLIGRQTRRGPVVQRLVEVVLKNL